MDKLSDRYYKEIGGKLNNFSYGRNSIYRFYEESKLPYFLILFLISPAFAFLSGITNLKLKGAKKILILFMGVVGYTIIINPGADSETLKLTFLNHYQYLTFSGFIDEITNMLMLKSTGVTVDEPYLSIVSFTLSRFTDNPRWLFAITGLVYGYFFIKGISLVFSEVKNKWTLPLIILFVFFFSWVTIDGVYAPRNFTAAWILFCGTFLYYKTRENKYIIWVLFAPLVHIAYAAIMLPFFGYLLLGHRKYLYIILLVISFFASAHMSFLKPILGATEIGKTKTAQYSGEGWEKREAEQAKMDKSFHAKYYESAAKLSIQFMFFISILFSGYIKDELHDHFQKALAGVAFLLLTFSNLVATVIPVLGNRLFLSFGLVALAYLIRLYSKNFEELKNKRWVIYACLPAILLFVFTQWSTVGNMLDFKVLVSPLLYPFVGDDPISIKAYLREILGV